MRAMMFLVQAASFRCKRQAKLFSTAFEILSYRPFAAAAAPRPPASFEQDDRVGLHRIRLHLSFRPWLVRYCGAGEHSAPARLQRDRNRRQHHV